MFYDVKLKRKCDHMLTTHIYDCFEIDDTDEWSNGIENSETPETDTIIITDSGTIKAG